MARWLRAAVGPSFRELTSVLCNVGRRLDRGEGVCPSMGPTGARKDIVRDAPQGLTTEDQQARASKAPERISAEYTAYRSCP